MKPQRIDASGRKSEQPAIHPQPRLTPVQTSLGHAHQKSDSAATNGQEEELNFLKSFSASHHHPTFKSSVPGSEIISK